MSMTNAYRQRRVTFAVLDSCLVRTTHDDATGRSYEHRCGLDAYRTVAHALAETPEQGAGTTLETIARQEGLPYTRVNVALEFLKDRDVVDVRHRRCYPANADATFEDAMIAYHYLEAHPSE
jgi:hypothetical protein